MAKRVKAIAMRLHPVCIIEDCPRKGRPMNVMVYTDGSYRGGHHFDFGGEFEREYGREYWECPSCYWGRG